MSARTRLDFPIRQSSSHWPSARFTERVCNCYELLISIMRRSSRERMELNEEKTIFTGHCEVKLIINSSRWLINSWHDFPADARGMQSFFFHFFWRSRMRLSSEIRLRSRKGFRDRYAIELCVCRYCSRELWNNRKAISTGANVTKNLSCFMARAYHKFVFYRHKLSETAATICSPSFPFPLPHVDVCTHVRKALKCGLPGAYFEHPHHPLAGRP